MDPHLWVALHTSGVRLKCPAKDERDGKNRAELKCSAIGRYQPGKFNECSKHALRPEIISQLDAHRPPRPPGRWFPSRSSSNIFCILPHLSRVSSERVKLQWFYSEISSEPENPDFGGVAHSPLVYGIACFSQTTLVPAASIDRRMRSGVCRIADVFRRGLHNPAAEPGSMRDTTNTDNDSHRT